MSSSGSGPYDYVPAESWRSWQRDEFESFHGPPSRYNWSRMQPGFSHSPPPEEPTNLYNWNRMQTRLPHSPPLEEPATFQSQISGFHHPVLPNPRRATGGPVSRYNSSLTGHRPQGSRPPSYRVLVLEDGVHGNASPTQFPRLDPSPPPPRPPSFQFLFQRHDNPQSSSNESKLTKEEQRKVLSKLKKERYNPTTRTLPNLYFRDKNQAAPEMSKEKDENWKRCPICLEDFEPREEVSLTPCNHMFHEECIVPWVKDQGMCPVCRFAICDRLKENSAAPARATGATRPHPPLPPAPVVDRDMLAIMRALMLDDDYEMQNMIPVLIGR